MTGRRLLHWAVEYYSTVPEPYLCVTLRGSEPHGIIRRRPIPVAERITLPFEQGTPMDYRANQAVVRRAMRHSRHRWRGRIP